MNAVRLRRMVAAWGGIAGLALLLWACAPAYRGAPILEPLELEDPQALLGQQVFFSVCHQCHPSGGAGIGLGITNKPLPDAVIRFQVRNGIGQMPAFSEDEIGEAELDGLIAYLNELRERVLESAEIEAPDEAP